MVISFRARNPVTEYTAICSFVLEVRGNNTLLVCTAAGLALMGRRFILSTQYITHRQGSSDGQELPSRCSRPSEFARTLRQRAVDRAHFHRQHRRDARHQIQSIIHQSKHWKTKKLLITCVQEPNSLFALGEHVVTYTASDAAGNSARCQFTVNVLRKCHPLSLLKYLIHSLYSF